MLAAYWDLLEKSHRVDQSREKRRLRSERDRAFDLSDTDFKKRYRLSKDMVSNLVHDLAPYLPRQRRSTAIAAETKVLIALGFYASGSYQSLVGQAAEHRVSQSTVSKVVHQVTAALNRPEIKDKYLVFPTSRQQRDEIKDVFHAKYHIPGVLGCIGGTHVAIIRPKRHEERYLNRKQYHSTNVMIICDANLKILSVDPSCAGATPDDMVWQNHPLHDHMEDLSKNEEVFLLGDSGYTLRRWLMTPILDASEGTPEHNYNELHVTARSTVERCIGALKARFRCLLAARALHYHPKTAAHIVHACCVLHNLAQSGGIEYAELSEDEAAQEWELTAGAADVTTCCYAASQPQEAEATAFRAALALRLSRD